MGLCLVNLRRVVKFALPQTVVRCLESTSTSDGNSAYCFIISSRNPHCGDDIAGGLVIEGQRTNRQSRLGSRVCMVV